MDAKEFLARLLPQSGLIAIVAPYTFYDQESKKDKTVYPAKTFDTTEAAVAAAADMVWGGKDVFFALSTYKEEKVWNATLQRYQTRTQTNSKALKAFFLDLDIDPNPSEKKVDKTFPSKPVAVMALKEFCKRVGMPKPMVVDSGGGLHVYWPLTTDVDTERWTKAAEKFKNICLHQRLSIDPAVPADSARVLRLLGSYNMKKANAREVHLLSQPSGPFDITMYEHLFDAFIDSNGVTGSLARKPSNRGTPAVSNLASSILGDNMGVTNEPKNADRIAFHCEFFGAQVASRGAGVSEPDWNKGCSIAQFCENREHVLTAISDQGKGYSYEATLQKAARWTGPTTCTSVWKDNKHMCERCPSFGKISSPAQLGRTFQKSAPPLVALALPGVEEPVQIIIPNPPAPYVRYKGTICVRTEDDDGKELMDEIVPFDIYPVRIIRQTCGDNDVKELTQWCVHLDRVGATYIDIPQVILADSRKLQHLLYEKGAYTHSTKTAELQTCMSAYLRELSKQQDREKAYERMGWHNHDVDFVLGETVIHRDGTTSKHRLADSARNGTKGSIKTHGTLEEWKDAMNFYQGPGNEANRIFIYTSFASTLMHLTPHKGIILAAAGATGKGKTTILQAQASVWGSPSEYVVNGNPDGTTMNALYNKASVYHNLPYTLDDTTDRLPDEMRKLFLNWPQGKDKERMKGNEHDGKNNSWCGFLCLSTNADNAAQITAAGKESQPHLMRLMTVQFNLVNDTTEAKIEADRYMRRLATNYGHAGVAFMRYVVPRAEEIRARIITMNELIDRALDIKPHERFWSGGFSQMFVAAQITRELGLLNYPIEHDFEWMKAHIYQLRQVAASHDVVPIDIVNDFLNAMLPNTLVISAKNTSNIDNIAVRPHGNGGLLVRHDFDDGGIYIARSAFTEYCIKHKISFRQIEDKLVKEGIIVATNAQKVLGADTAYAKGQTRCWKVSATKLGEGYKDVVIPAMAGLKT